MEGIVFCPGFPRQTRRETTWTQIQIQIRQTHSTEEAARRTGLASREKRISSATGPRYIFRWFCLPRKTKSFYFLHHSPTGWIGFWLWVSSFFLRFVDDSIRQSRLSGVFARRRLQSPILRRCAGGPVASLITAAHSSSDHSCICIHTATTQERAKRYIHQASTRPTPV